MSGPWRLVGGLLILLTVATAVGACRKTQVPTVPSESAAGAGAPGVVAPAEGADVDVRPELRVQNVGGDGEDRTYQFQVADNTNFAGSLFATVPEGAGGVTAYRPEDPLRAETTYYWRARFKQGGSVGPFTATLSFSTRANAPPLILSLSTSGDRAEVGEAFQLSAAVSDVDTPVAELTFEWTAPTGVFAGEGASVTWTPQPGDQTPATVEITLTVIEVYEGREEDGTAGMRENRTSMSVTVHVNASIQEITALVDTFLTDFSDSNVPADVAVRNFSDACGGKLAERDEIEINRRVFEILSSTFSVTGVGPNPQRTMANVVAPCEFTSRVRATGQIEVATGTCMLQAVYEPYEWFLCESEFKEAGAAGLRRTRP